MAAITESANFNLTSNIIKIGGSTMFNYEAMSNDELISAIIGGNISKEITKKLMNEYADLPCLLAESTEQELLQIKGIGIKRSQRIKACYELAKRLYTKPSNTTTTIKSPQDVSNLMMPEMRFLKKEQFNIILLNTKNHVIEIKTVSVGSLSSSIVHPREVFAMAVKRAASGIILLHNHPSGDPEPSREDIETTNRLVNAGNILGIRVLDHVIIGDGRFISLKEEGLM